MFESVLSPNSYFEILNPKVMVLGDGAFGRCLSHKNGAFMNGISTPIKALPRELTHPVCPVKTQ